MPSHEEMIAVHAEHRLVNTTNFRSVEKYVMYLIHIFPYLQAAKLAANKTVLDLGCNNGYGSEILFNSAKKVVGVDVSERAVSAAKIRYKHLPIDFQTIDGRRLPFENNEFEMVVSFQVIEHIVDQNLYLNELKRVLAPNGTVLFTTPNSLIRLFPGMKPWNRFHVREFAPAELETFLESYFSAVRIFGLFANEPLCSIEVNRVDRKRKAASEKLRKDDISDKKSEFEKSAPTIAPEAESSLKIEKFVQMFIDRYGTADLFYRLEEMNQAMDLLAVCTDNLSILQETASQIIPQNV